jgi:formylglycine-generating enzyme required for sulfatase activity
LRAGANLYDTLGNAWEWVNDYWGDASLYQAGASQDPMGPSSGQIGVFRGGSWSDDPRYVRVSVRNYFNLTSRFDFAGVRCVGEANIP